MIEGGDGGASVTLNGGESWSSLENQPTADLLSLAVDDQEPYWLYGAQNDNSHIAIPESNRRSVHRMEALPSPSRPARAGRRRSSPTAAWSMQMTGPGRSVSTGKPGRPRTSAFGPSVEFGTAVKDVKYRFYYSFPVLLSPHDPWCALHRRPVRLPIHGRRPILGPDQSRPHAQPPGSDGRNIRRAHQFQRVLALFT